MHHGLTQPSRSTPFSQGAWRRMAWRKPSRCTMSYVEILRQRTVHFGETSLNQLTESLLAKKKNGECVASNWT